MTLPAKIVLETPISDQSALNSFVEQCLKDGVVLIAVVGPQCAEIEDLIDEIVVGDGSDETRFVVTTSHEGEPLEEVLEFARSWDDGQIRSTEIVRL